MGQKVGCRGYENVPLRSPLARNEIDKGPQLLSSEIHGWVRSEATDVAGCTEPMPEWQGNCSGPFLRDVGLI